MSQQQDTHSDNTSKVCFWVNKELLAKWDAFAKEHSISRTDLIREAVSDRVFGKGIHVEVSTASMEKIMEERFAKMEQMVGHLTRGPGMGSLTETKESFTTDITIVENAIKAAGSAGINESEIRGVNEVSKVKAISALKKDKKIAATSNGWRWIA